MSSVWVTVSFPGAARVLTTKRDGLITKGSRGHTRAPNQLNFFCLVIFSREKSLHGVHVESRTVVFISFMHASLGSRIQISDFGAVD